MPQFIVKYGIEIMQKKLRFQALLHFMNMVEFGRLSVEVSLADRR